MTRANRLFLLTLLTAFLIVACLLFRRADAAGLSVIYLPLVRNTAAAEYPPLVWDERLDALGVTLARAECAGGCWRLISARWEDEEESQGLHHIWTRALSPTGEQWGGVPWVVFWPTGEVHLVTKPAPDWADYALFGCYFPDEGPGPYTAYVGDDIQASDRVAGMGLPACRHTSFRLIWQWQPTN